MDKIEEYKQIDKAQREENYDFYKKQQEVSGSWSFAGHYTGGYNVAILTLRKDSQAYDLFGIDDSIEKPLILCNGMCRRNDGFLTIWYLDTAALKNNIQNIWYEEESHNLSPTSFEHIIHDELFSGKFLIGGIFDKVKFKPSVRKVVVSMSEILGYKMYEHYDFNDLLEYFDRMGFKNLIKRDYYHKKYNSFHIKEEIVEK